ncbi:hypothetical protein Hanom_Chr07g00635251 [Helianthus anomalus]
MFLADNKKRCYPHAVIPQKNKPLTEQKGITLSPFTGYSTKPTRLMGPYASNSLFTLLSVVS